MAKQIRILHVLNLLLLLTTGCYQSNSSFLRTSGESVLETHYSPVENLEALDRNAFLSAHSSIDICAYSLTDHLLIDALAEAASRGVKIRIYLDRGQTQEEISREGKHRNNESRVDAAEEATGLDDMTGLRKLAVTENVAVRVKHSQTLMHLKSYSVDSILLRSGSANFSPTGEKRQDNDVTFTRDAVSIRRFENNFELLWGRTDNEPLMRSNIGVAPYRGFLPLDRDR